MERAPALLAGWAAAHPRAAAVAGALVALLALLQAYLAVVKARYRHIVGPPGYAFVGHVPYLTQEPWKRFAEFAARYGPVYKLWVFNKLFVVISEPELVKQVFVTRRHVYPKDAWSYKFMMCVGVHVGRGAGCGAGGALRMARRSRRGWRGVRGALT